MDINSYHGIINEIFAAERELRRVKTLHRLGKLPTEAAKDAFVGIHMSLYVALYILAF